MGIQVAVLNASADVPDGDVQAVVAALDVQLQRDFTPAWALAAQVSFVPRGHPPPPAAWWLVVLDTPDRPGASGYHDVTSAGLPIGKVFTSGEAGFDPQWSISASHELLEMIADPGSNVAVFTNRSDGGLRLYAREVCDPCEATAYSYRIGGVHVSDFVFPAWFQQQNPPGAVYDQTGSVREPFELLPGGFISRLDLPGGTQWEPVFAAALDGSRPRLCSHSRTVRRRMASEYR